MPDINAQRSAALWSWFVALCSSRALGVPQGHLQAVSGDASFRRYFRALTDRGSWILVDAPPEREDSAPFLDVQQRLQQGGVRVPTALAADLQNGFMCLEDFGSELLLSRLEARPDTAGAWYRCAFEQLLRIQTSPTDHPPLPDYNEALLRREMQLFSEWLWQGLLGLQASAAEQALWQDVQTQLVQAALAQPRVFVHRDYHARNLMAIEAGGANAVVGVIDFQDAVLGPCTYDLVSLLKDCYLAWPAAQVRQWVLDWLVMARASEPLAALYTMDDADFLDAFDLMGTQRHLKAAGIFCRLWLRDGKPGYLQDIPRTLAYITRQESAGSQRDFADFLEQKLLPTLTGTLQQLRQDGTFDGARA